jgi:hypothetical protein
MGLQQPAAMRSIEAGIGRGRKVSLARAGG